MTFKTVVAAVTAATLLLGNAAQAASQTAVFAGGCFWSMEKGFEATPGVLAAVSGYAGGAKANPTYRDHEGYLEAVKVTYDPAKISYSQLVDAYYHHIDPTDPNGQICDHGPSYMLAVFAGSAQERQVAETARAKYQRELGAKITVATRAAAPFWTAEGYHQDFAKRNPLRYEQYRIGCGRDRVLKVVWGGR